jgi:hypothetical protein
MLFLQNVSGALTVFIKKALKAFNEPSQNFKSILNQLKVINMDFFNL